MDQFHKSRTDSDQVLVFSAIVEHLSLRYGRDDIINGVQDIIEQLFTLLSESTNPQTKNAHLIVWIDETLSYGRSDHAGKKKTLWRFFVSSEDMHADLANEIVKVLNDNVGWMYIGWQLGTPTYSTPIFEYDKGECSIFFIRDKLSNGSERIGYLDIDFDGNDPQLVFSAMHGTRGERVRAEGDNPNPILFKIKFVQDIEGYEDAAVVKAESIGDSKPSTKNEDKSKAQPKILFLNLFPDHMKTITKKIEASPFTKRIHEAFDFAAIHHFGQNRKDPDLEIPYISHLFGVAYILAQHGFSEDTIIAGVLHDLIEDVIKKKDKPELTEEVIKHFGENVYRLVDWVSQVKKDQQGRKIPWQERTTAYIERIRLAPIEAKAISCADKIHNIQSLLMGFERGTPMWQSLKATPEEQLAKFKMLHQSLRSHWDHPILSDLERKIGELEGWLPNDHEIGKRKGTSRIT